MITYLYVKVHTETKLKYFGKTSRKDPFKYKGSGTYWRRHLAKHGDSSVITTDVWGFDDLEMLTAFAVHFSITHNIVESNEWANLKIEDGLMGGARAPFTHSDETKAKISHAKSGKPNIKLRGRARCDETKHRISIANAGKTRSKEQRARMSAAQCRAHEQNSDLGRQKSRNGELNGMYGKTHSPEARTLISAAQKGRNLGKSYEERYGERSTEIKMNRSESLKRVRHNKPHTGRNNPRYDHTVYKFVRGEEAFVGTRSEFAMAYNDIKGPGLCALLKRQIPHYKGWTASSAQ